MASDSGQSPAAEAARQLGESVVEVPGSLPHDGDNSCGEGGNESFSGASVAPESQFSSERLDEACLQRFLDWMQVNGGQFINCHIKYCREEQHQSYGMFASSQGAEGIHLVTPLHLAISPVTILKDPLLGEEYMKLFENGDVDDRLLIMLFLIVERARGNSSFWAPYLDILPVKFGNPVFYSPEELLELRGTALFSATEAQVKSLRRVFDDRVTPLAARFFSLAGLSDRAVAYEDFVWANCAFWTRALSIPCPHRYVFPTGPRAQSTQALASGSLDDNPASSLNDDPASEAMEGGLPNGDMPDSRKIHAQHVARKETTASDAKHVPPKETAESNGTELVVPVEGLVPGIDFCNHDVRATTLWEVDNSEGTSTNVPWSMFLITLPGYNHDPNKEIRIKYGNKGNEELLFLYGFVLDDNPDDFIMVHFPRRLLEQSPCAEEKLRFLAAQGLELRWLLSVSLLKVGFLRKSQNGDRSSVPDVEPESTTASSGYSWSGNRKRPRHTYQTFPEPVLAALRTLAMTEAQYLETMALLDQLTDSGRVRQPTKEDISAAVWEVCGDAGAYKLLIDLLISLKFGLDEGTGTRQMDSALLERDRVARLRLSTRTLEPMTLESDLLSTNKRSCIIYRMGQKELAELFLAAAEEAFDLSEE